MADRPGPKRGWAVVIVDEENAAPTWWNAVREKGGQIARIGEALGCGENVVPRWWLAEVSGLPGWSDGPTHARHPLSIIG